MNMLAHATVFLNVGAVTCCDTIKADTNGILDRCRLNIQGLGRTAGEDKSLGGLVKLGHTDLAGCQEHRSMLIA